MAEDVFGIVGTTQAGNFHVERVVAEGGFGVVYRAQHGAFRAPVALKCLKVPRAMTEEQQAAFLENFRSEAELLFRLSASIPEVVRPLHADALHLDNDRFVPFLALEWLDGEALDGIVTRRRESGQAPIGLHKLMRLLKPIAHALARAHRFPGPSGPTAIIHRDLKPDNIFVARVNGIDAVKILDFGIAKCKSAATSIAGRQTGDEALTAFTPAYAAPEQWLPKRYGSTGPWTDVWGLAITMVEVLAGRPPIDGEVAAMMGTAIDEGRRPTPRAEGVVVSPEIDKAFERALAVDPRNRTKDVETFWTELERAMGSSLSFTSYDPRREDDAPATGRLRTEVAPSGVPPPPSLRSPAPPPRSGPTPEVRLAATVAAPVSAPGSRPPGLQLPDLDLPDQAPPRSAARAAPAPLELDLAPSASVGTPHTPGSVGTPHTPGSVGTPHTPASGERAPGPLEGGRAAAVIDAPREPAASAGGLTDTMGFERISAGGDAAFSSAPPSRGATPASGRGPTSTGPHAGAGFDLAASPRSRPATSLRMAEQLRDAGEQLAELGDLRDRLRLPLTLIGIALAITIADVAMARFGGGAISVGPVRAWWVAGPLAISGVALAFWRVFMDGDDG